jgi:hypothetical protein
MARGVWSFLYEWAIYEYLMTRFDEGTLRLKAVRRSGNYVGREKWVKVTGLQPIKDSSFPDVKSIHRLCLGSNRDNAYTQILSHCQSSETAT